MIKSWVLYWFVAVVLFVVSKALKKSKHQSLTISLNVLAIVFAAVATWMMLKN
ncbi:hypothetical protein [Portibacter marinus]|uniref:hypothetical protein n=1 Tax=Portibacter marinus TaxID=2898660 RepID=UPI001F454028|nr:hypothetical protein [Portibacter marinus]